MSHTYKQYITQRDPLRQSMLTLVFEVSVLEILDKQDAFLYSS